MAIVRSRQGLRRFCVRRVVAIAVDDNNYGMNLMLQTDEGTVSAWSFSDNIGYIDPGEVYLPGDCTVRQTSTKTFTVHGDRDGVGGAF